MSETQAGPRGGSAGLGARLLRWPFSGVTTPGHQLCHTPGPHTAWLPWPEPCLWVVQGQRAVPSRKTGESRESGARGKSRMATHLTHAPHSGSRRLGGMASWGLCHTKGGAWSAHTMQEGTCARDLGGATRLQLPRGQQRGYVTCPAWGDREGTGGRALPRPGPPRSTEKVTASKTLQLSGNL